MLALAYWLNGNMIRASYAMAKADGSVLQLSIQPDNSAANYCSQCLQKPESDIVCTAFSQNFKPVLELNVQVFRNFQHGCPIVRRLRVLESRRGGADVSKQCEMGVVKKQCLRGLTMVDTNSNMDAVRLSLATCKTTLFGRQEIG